MSSMHQLKAMKSMHGHDEDKVARKLGDLIDTIKKIFGHKPKGRLDLAFGLPTNKKGNSNMPVEVTITNEQQVNVKLNPKTDSGKPAKLDGAPVWSVVSGDSAVVPAADGMSADLVSSDTPGDTTFLIDGDADLGSGVEDVQETITLHVAGANAKNLGVVVGTPTLKPTA